jgi:hypothetical protein
MDAIAILIVVTRGFCHVGNVTVCGTADSTVVVEFLGGKVWNTRLYTPGAAINVASDGTVPLFPGLTCDSFPGTLRLIVGLVPTIPYFQKPDFNATLFNIGLGNISSAGDSCCTHYPYNMLLRCIQEDPVLAVLSVELCY